MRLRTRSSGTVPRLFFGVSLLLAATLLPALFVSTLAAVGAAQEPEQPAAPPELPEVEETTVVGDTPQADNPNQGANEPITTTTPTRSETPIAEVGSSVTVITREQIERSGFTNVADVLRGVPGVDVVQQALPGLDVVQQGGPGRLTTVFIRGANSQQTKVLLDGIPLNDPSNASRLFDFANLTTDNIERIEVLRGPQSTLYGSDAIGGVINIITARGEGPLTVRGSTMGGSFGTTNGVANVSGGTDLYNYSFGMSFFNNDGFSAAAKQLGNHEKDGYRNTTFSGRFGLTPFEAFEVDYIFRYIDANAEVDDFDFATGLPVDNFYRHNLTESFFQRVQLRSVLFDGMIEAKAGFNLTNYNRFDTDPGPFVPEQFKGQTRMFDAQVNTLVSENNTFTVGTDYQNEDAMSTFDPMASQNLAGFYALDKFSFGDRWFATAGYRFDEQSVAGSAETYRFTNAIDVWETGTTFRGSIGTGFRAPALAENLFAFGNRNLRPETSKGWDVGIEQALLDGDVTFMATYFRNDFRNLIVFDLDTFLLENIGVALASGVEFSSLVHLTDTTSVVGTYTYTETRDRDTGEELLRRPKNKASIGIVQYFDNNRAALSMNVLIVGRRRDTVRELSGYTVAYMNGYYNLNDYWQLYGRVDNVFDEYYEEVAGFGVANLSAYGGVRLVW